MLRDLQALFPEAFDGPPPPLPGAYLLAITLSFPLVGAARGVPYTLAAGTYCYAGSANGPGGIKARVGRHMRLTKKAHWHIDTLTNASSRIIALSFPEGRECALVERLLEAGCDIPVPGFGSSDCRRCEAHLLRLNRAGGNPRAVG